MAPELSDMIIVAATACVAVLVLVPLLRPVAVWLRLVDRPGGRKLHKGDIPLIGGVAIFLAYPIGMMTSNSPLLLDVRVFWVCAVLVVLGLINDIRHVLVGIRVLVQVLLILFLCGFTQTHLRSLGDLVGNGDIMLGTWGLPLTILGLIGVKNGINLLDGLDGLAGTQVLVALLWFIFLSWGSGAPETILIMMPLVGAVVGFLAYNLRLPRRRAWVFLGDHGSVFLGFALGWFAVVGSQGRQPAFAPIEGVWVLGLPVLETIRVMLSRIIRGISPFQPGRDHLHHLLLGMGLSGNAVVMVMMAFAGILGAVPWVGRMLGMTEVTLFCAFLGLSAVYFLWAQDIDHRLHRGEYQRRRAKP
jgi:UDP-GlcNAc:undecaprenyl-phosphate/decaprenyl-phosphate GlcNAc-1-phosphate transferase